MKVLVVDDDKIARKALSALLRKQGLVTIEASDGARGLAVLQDNRDIAIVFTDIMMPVMDGYELLQEISQLNNAPPVVAVSGKVGFKAIDGVMEKGAFAFLRKPVERTELVEVLVSLLRQGRKLAIS